MNIGVLDILDLPSCNPARTVYHLLMTKQYAAITPQAISFWCRRMGHRTFYATYYGVGAPERKLPKDLDVLFIACHTPTSGLAYAVSKIFRRRGTRTVVGGPHAKAFPLDCSRFFDVTVKDCDRGLVERILADEFEPGSIVTCDPDYDELPTIEERMPEVRKSAFAFGRKYVFSTTIPLLGSVGCPYDCNFCIDWNSTYKTLSTDRLRTELEYLAKHLPGTFIAFHDPNFAIKFDQVLDVLASLPRGQRLPYIVESSLSVLRGDRPKRLKETNCASMAPGIESWMDFSKKAGVGKMLGMQKVEQVAAHCREIQDNVPYIQGNFILGLDTDVGDEPFELTKSFMTLAPFVWPAINIPVPFGNTPLYDTHLSEGRLRRQMPFQFYYAPYLVTTLKHYEPIRYYEKFIELLEHASSMRMLSRRLPTTWSNVARTVHCARTAGMRAAIPSYRRVLNFLKTDRTFRRFHEGESDALPSFYQQEYDRLLGKYAVLISPQERIPRLAEPTTSAAKPQPLVKLAV